jgi:hypothetical protein
MFSRIPLKESSYMKKNEFIGYLKNNEKNFEFADAPLDGADGVYVKNHMYDTETHFTDEVINNMELDDLVKATHQGKNIEQMTRVTGYFSKVSKWNKGKKGELKDRHRVDEV